MLRKSNSYSGYILLESLIALGLLCMIVGSFIAFSTLLLKKNKEATEQLAMYRVLYEETKGYENDREQSDQDGQVSDNRYQVEFGKVDNKLIKVEITNGKESFLLKKE